MNSLSETADSLREARKRIRREHPDAGEGKEGFRSALLDYKKIKDSNFIPAAHFLFCDRMRLPPPTKPLTETKIAKELELEFNIPKRAPTGFYFDLLDEYFESEDGLDETLLETHLQMEIERCAIKEMVRNFGPAFDFGTFRALNQREFMVRFTELYCSKEFGSYDSATFADQKELLTPWAHKTLTELKEYAEQGSEPLLAYLALETWTNLYEEREDELETSDLLEEKLKENARLKLMNERLMEELERLQQSLPVLMNSTPPADV